MPSERKWARHGTAVRISCINKQDSADHCILIPIACAMAEALRTANWCKAAGKSFLPLPIPGRQTLFLAASAPLAKLWFSRLSMPVCFPARNQQKNKIISLCLSVYLLLPFDSQTGTISQPWFPRQPSRINHESQHHSSVLGEV